MTGSTRAILFASLDTGRPAYHASVHLKLYVYGYLNRVHSSRRLEREAGRNLEVMWLLQRLAPDFKTIDFSHDQVERMFGRSDGGVSSTLQPTKFNITRA